MPLERPTAKVSLFFAALLLLGPGYPAAGQEAGAGAGQTGPEADSRAAGKRPASGLRDAAGLFDDPTRKMAESGFLKWDAAGRVPVLIETIASLDGRPIEAVTLEHARRLDREGLYILIVKEDQQINVIASRDYLDPFDAAARAKVRDAFLDPFRAGHFDEGLRDGIRTIQNVIERNTDESPARAREARGVAEIEGPLVSRGHVRLSLAGAETILRAAREQAEAMGLKVNVAVVDDGGHLIAFARMDGARPGSGYTAQSKAVAAATFRMPTGPIPPGTAEPDPILNLGLSLAAMAGGGRATPLYGGVPVEVEGQVIGAVGVGGGTGEQDAAVARAGIAALLRALEDRAE